MMDVAARATMASTFLALVMKATACHEPVLESTDASCAAEALAACAWVLSVSEGRGDPESACVYVCEHTQPAPELR